MSLTKFLWTTLEIVFNSARNPWTPCLDSVSRTFIATEAPFFSFPCTNQAATIKPIEDGFLETKREEISHGRFKSLPGKCWKKSTSILKMIFQEMGEEILKITRTICKCDGQSTKTPTTGQAKTLGGGGGGGGGGEEGGGEREIFL